MRDFIIYFGNINGRRIILHIYYIYTYTCMNIETDTNKQLIASILNLNLYKNWLLSLPHLYIFNMVMFLTDGTIEITILK